MTIYYQENKKKQVLARVRMKGSPCTVWWECKLVWSLWKTVWGLLKKLKIGLVYDPLISLLDIYPKER